MALNTMEKLYLCLANMVPRIEIAEDLRRAALKPLVRMLEMSPPAAGAPARSSPEAELSAEAARRGVA
jgi:quinolinate synthase